MSNWWENLKGLVGWSSKPQPVTGANSGFTVLSRNPVTGVYEQVRIPNITSTKDVSSLNGMTRIDANYGDDMTEASQIGQQVVNSGDMTWQQGLGYGLAGLQTLSGLANAYLGFKNYRLAKDQFGFEKAAINRNIANQAKQINNAYDSSASIAAAMAGTDANGVLRPEVRERYMNEAKNRHVDGSKIG